MMKKYRYVLFIGLIVLIAGACRQNNLDELKAIQNTDRNVSGAGTDANGIVAGNEIVKVPFKISLSGPATKAFQVGITFNNDTVSKLIANGTLKNTVMLPAGAIDYDGVINVAFGADTASSVASVRLSAIEANYGKNVAFAFKLTDPGKGNQIKGSQSNILVVLDTKTLIKESDIHYVSLLNGGGILNVDYQKNYTTSPAGITIPLTINLAGVPAGAFNVNVKLNMDTIADLVSKKVLPDNTIALKPDQYNIDTLIRVNSNASTAVIRLSIGWPVFDANIAANKRFGFVVSLVNPSKHILHPTNSKMIVLVQPEVNLDNNSYITGNGTGLKAEYFSNNQQLDFDGRKPDLVQIEPTIDWPNDGVWQAAIPSISHDNFSTRWTGEFLAPVRGEYVFWQNEWDDGSRLYIDGKPIINDFTTEWDKDSRTAKIFLERGKRYKIEADHRENVGGQRARLTFEVPSAGINGRRIVPQSQLFPAP
ncbi:PA14 domain-containing protein [Mucilaginibacter endophyticus]|uniref:PA14 domain-containing protein n=1 Tax=Mucilaginibacter endophyticus TaxID=2675003 RepID=UPI000E0D229D|nr:PA14 domain-containing protein [Mucilaginibacter endophyticus]